MIDHIKITALYSRLSVGDEERDGGDNNSIQNRKKFPESYVRQLKLTNIRHCIDKERGALRFIIVVSKSYPRQGQIRCCRRLSGGGEKHKPV